MFELRSYRFGVKFGLFAWDKERKKTKKERQKERKKVTELGYFLELPVAQRHDLFR
jgi:uncharacterized protein YcgL (UPF0745 family)